MLNFLPKVVIWWNVGDALLGSSEYAIMGLVNLLLHCNASDLVLEILKKMTKSGGQFASASNRSNSGGLGDSSPVIYAHGLGRRARRGGTTGWMSVLRSRGRWFDTRSERIYVTTPDKLIIT